VLSSKENHERVNFPKTLSVSTKFSESFRATRLNGQKGPAPPKPQRFKKQNQTGSPLNEQKLPQPLSSDSGPNNDPPPPARKSWCGGGYLLLLARRRCEV
jgi:hypothetical protein